MISPPITIEALIVLDAIAERGSYAAAAEQLHKVPSSLSYIVQKLEEQLNVTVFERQGRRSVLTPAGKYLLEDGRKLLSAMAGLAEKTQTIANGWEPKIRVACDSIIDIQFVFKGIEAFLSHHPDIELDIQEQVMNGTWEALINDQVDLVIGAPAPAPIQKGLVAIKICDLESVLVAHPKHELAKHTGLIMPEQLTEQRTVVVHDSAQQEIPRSINVIQGSRHFFVSSINQKIAAISAGIGIGYLPKQLINFYLERQQLVRLNVSEALPLEDLFIAWKVTNKGKGLQGLQKQLVKHFSQNL